MTPHSGELTHFDRQSDALVPHHCAPHITPISSGRLFADAPSLEQPLPALKEESVQQRDRDGSLLTKLPPMHFYKPQGNLNMHAAYTDEASGDRYIDRAIEELRKSP
jgi:hypothetical protein